MSGGDKKSYLFSYKGRRNENLDCNDNESFTGKIYIIWKLGVKVPVPNWRCKCSFQA